MLVSSGGRSETVSVQSVAAKRVSETNIAVCLFEAQYAVVGK